MEPVEEHGVESGYCDVAGVNSLLFLLNDRQRGFFERFLAERPVAAVLDVGCGTGEHHYTS